MTREDAIEIVQSATVWTDEEREALAMLIPELAESDDEKIRKEMVRYFTEMKKGGSAALSYDDCIAYLEKQEEEEGYEAIPVESTLEYKLGFNAGKETRWSPTKEQINALETTVRLSNFGCDKERRKILLSLLEQLKQSEEKQKEQKPADEAEKFFDSAESYNQGFVAGQKKMKEDIEKGFGISEHSLDYLAGRYAGYAAARQEQKPAEWSEKDRRIIDRACVTLRAYANGELPDILPSEILECVDKLKSICQQPKPEWSEEDDRICHLIMANLSESARHAITLPMETVNDFNNWLRTLQYMPPVFTDWNEEDQTLLSDALGCVTMVQELKKRGNLKNFHISCSYDELRSWVRSLKSRPRKQPSWNPSEEQPKMNIPSAGSGAMGTTPPKFKLDVKPVQPEVDLEKEIDDYIAFNFSEAADGILISDANSTELQITDVSQIARHFYELGKLNVRKKE